MNALAASFAVALTQQQQQQQQPQNGTGGSEPARVEDYVISGVSLVLFVPPLIVLSILVLVMVIGRICKSELNLQSNAESAPEYDGSSGSEKARRRRSSSHAAHTPRKRFTLTMGVFFVCLIIFSLYSIVLSIVVPVSDIVGRTAAFRVVMSVMYCFHFLLIQFIIAAYFSIWQNASIKVFNLMIFSSAAGGNSGNGTSAEAARQRRVRVMRALRTALTVLTVLTLLLGLAVGIALPIIVALNFSDLISTKGIEIAAYVVIPCAAVAAVMYALLCTIPAVLLVLALRRSNAMLKQQEADQTNGIDTKAAQKVNRNVLILRNRIQEQSIVARKLMLTVVLLVFMAVMLIIGLVLIAFNLIPFTLIDAIFLRTIPSMANVLMWTVLFWPWQLPSVLFCVRRRSNSTTAESNNRGAALLQPIKVQNIMHNDDDIEAGSVDDENDIIALDDDIAAHRRSAKKQQSKQELLQVEPVAVEVACTSATGLETIQSSDVTQIALEVVEEDTDVDKQEEQHQEVDVENDTVQAYV